MAMSATELQRGHALRMSSSVQTREADGAGREFAADRGNGSARERKGLLGVALALGSMVGVVVDVMHGRYDNF